MEDPDCQGLSVVDRSIHFGEAKSTVKVALAQISPAWDEDLVRGMTIVKCKDPEAQCQKIMKIIGLAESRGTEMILFPELVAPFKYLRDIEERLKAIPRDFISVIPYEHTPIEEIQTALSEEENALLGIGGYEGPASWANFYRISFNHGETLETYTQLKLTPFSGEFSLAARDTLFCGQHIYRFQTNWGSFIVLICKDYLGEIRGEKRIPMFNFIKELIGEGGLQYVFVCALNQDVEAFLHAARAFYYLEDKTQNTFTTFLNIAELNHTVTVFPKRPHPKIRMNPELVKLSPLFEKKPAWGTYLDFEGTEEKVVFADFMHLKHYSGLPTMEVFSPVHSVDVTILSEPLGVARGPALKASWSVDSHQVTLGDSVEIIISIDNPGKKEVPDVEFSLELPEGCSLVSGTREFSGGIPPGDGWTQILNFRTETVGSIVLGPLTIGYPGAKGRAEQIELAEIAIAVEEPSRPDIQVSRSLSRKVLRTREKLEVTYSVKNLGNTEGAFEIHLPAPEGFRLISGDELLKGLVEGRTCKEIRQTLMPVSDGELVLPAIRATFHDRKGQEYTSTEAPPVGVKVLFNLETDLVGREKEMTRLKEAMDLATGGQGRVVFIGGEAGVGKSRLINELLHHAESEDFVVLSGECHMGGGPYHVVHALLGSLFELNPGDLPDVVHQKIRGRLRDISKDWESMAPLFSHFLTATATQFASGRKDELFSVSSKLLVTLAQDFPLILSVDDLQWLDDESSEFLAAVALMLGESHILFVGNYRSEAKDLKEASKGFTDLLKKISRYPTFERWEISPLPPMGVERIIEQALGADIPDEVREMVIHRSGGSPLFAREILETLIREGMLQRRNGGWAAAEGIHFEDVFPSRIQDLIISRLDGLSESERNTLSYASALGKTFDLRVIQDALDISEDELFDNVINLEAYHFVREGDSGPDTYAFTHVMIQEIIYSQIKGLKRRLVHKKVGASLERLFSDDPDRVIDDLARQFSLARDREKAVVYLVKAGNKASRTYAPDHAVKCYGEALEYEETAPLLTELSKQLEVVGRYDDALDAIERALGLVQSDSAKTSLHRDAGIILRHKGIFDQAIHRLDQARALTTEEETMEVGEIHLQMAYTYRKMGRLDESMENCQAAIGILEKLEEKRRASNALNLKGLLLWTRGEFDGALEAYETSVKLKEEVGDERGIAGLWNNIGLIHGARSSWEKAVEYTLKAKEFFEKSGPLRALANAESNLGHFYHLQGELERSLSHTLNGLKLREKIGDEYGIGISHNNLGDIYMERGELNEAKEQYERSLVVAETLGDKEGVGFAKRGLAELMSRKGDRDAAIESAREALSTFMEVQSKEGIAHCEITLGEVLGCQCDEASGIEHCTRGIQLSVEMGNRYLEATGRWTQGRAMRAAGRTDEAAAEFERSAEIFSDIRAMGRVIQVLRDHAELEAERGNEVRADELRRKADALNTKDPP
jgi:tetratricopeptide (TPR) repeat protein/predicted amidohydrolase